MDNHYIRRTGISTLKTSFTRDDFPERLCCDAAQTSIWTGSRRSVACTYLPYNEDPESTENSERVKYWIELRNILEVFREGSR
jgi:hypothetical protein